MSFDPFGKRRNSNDWTYNNVPLTFKFDRGYTGHEHLDEFDLINMNGRCYDPSLARFISPDPFVQDFSSTQNLNRYSYALNNPLIFTDPSGYNYKPIDWNKPPTGGIAFNAGYRGNMGPGSGNHWSDAYRSEYVNFMLGNASSYDKMYGEGAWGKVLDLYSLDETGLGIDLWRDGSFSLQKSNIYFTVTSDKIYGSNSWSGLFSKNNNLSGIEILCIKISFGNKATGHWVGEMFDDGTSPFVGLGLKVVEDFGDDIFRGLGNGTKAVNKYYGPAANIWGGYNMVKTANNPDISNSRKTYDLAKNGIPIGIDVAIMLGALESTPAGWIGTGIGVAMEGAELFYDKVYTPTMNYLLDYSNRWDQWFINGGYTNYYSDQNLKTEITKIDSTLQKLLLLQAYRFKWKANNTNYDIGLLAQEVESVFPELVLTDSVGYKQIAYHKLVPILLQAIKEQDSIIKHQINSLEKYNQQLKQQELLLNDVIQRLNKIEKDK